MLQPRYQQVYADRVVQVTDTRSGGHRYEIHLKDRGRKANIPFLLWQMRNQYAPYPGLVSGELHRMLLRWIELNEKEDAE